MLKVVFALLALTTGAIGAEPLELQTKSARAVHDTMTGRPVVEVHLSPEGHEAFADFTITHVGKRVDVLVNDAVVISPIFQSPLDMPIIHITSLDTMDEATDIAVRLNGKKSRIFVRLADEQD